MQPTKHLTLHLFFLYSATKPATKLQEVIVCATVKHQKQKQEPNFHRQHCSPLVLIINNLANSVKFCKCLFRMVGTTARDIIKTCNLHDQPPASDSIMPTCATCADEKCQEISYNCATFENPYDLTVGMI